MQVLPELPKKKNQEVLSRPNCLIREGKVGWAPLSVSSRFLVLGTLVALHHGRESLSSVASELQLDPGREHSHPEQEDALMKELFIGKS